MTVFVSDIDDVLIPWVKSVCGFVSREYKIHITYEDFTHFNFMQIFGMSVTEVDEMLDAYFLSNDFLDLMIHSNDLRMLRNIKSLNDAFHVLTSRHDLIRPHTKLWLPQAAPGVFDGVHFSSNIHTDRSSGKSKTEILVDLKADYFSEDNLHYAFEAADVVKYVYMFRHPWNRNYSAKPTNVIEVDDWTEVFYHQHSLSL